MAKYIMNKQVDSLKVNNLEDFIGIGEAVWNFISTVYEANWNALHVNNNSTSLRRKIVAKFTLKTQSMCNDLKLELRLQLRQRLERS